MSMKECFHIVRHSNTPEDREKVVEMIEYARRIGDMQALPILLLQLETCEGSND